MDKSPHNSAVKKSGKSLKEKRADKKVKGAARSAADVVTESVSGTRRGR
ncbi:MAG: hypothetical protein ACRYF3_06890 [Janthinobacterium lividum]